MHTWGKTVDQALARIREAAALWLQTDEASIDLIPSPVLPKAAGRTVEQARQARVQARSAGGLAVETKSSGSARQPRDQHPRQRPRSSASRISASHQLLISDEPRRKTS